MQARTRVSGRRCLGAILIALVGFSVNVSADPMGGQVVGGSATIQGQSTSNVTVNQFSNRVILNWQSFNIGVGETTRFIQPNAASVALNRVVGARSPSSIFGNLTANGQVFLVNPEGFIFGKTAVVNTAGFLATTHDIKDTDFLAGRYLFNISGNPKASIINQGTFSVGDVGIAALVAPAVRNDGIITARLGKIALAAGNGFALDLYGDNLIKFQLNDAIAAQVIDVSTGRPITSLIENRGKLSARGGTVALTAVTARALVDSVINNSGVIEARSVGTANGRIVLGAQTAKTKVQGAPVQTVKVSGTLDVAGKDQGTIGGTVQITGESIALAGVIIDASGISGGGKVLIGGDTGGGILNPAVSGVRQAAMEQTSIPTATTVTVDAASAINASAINKGNGGKIVIWSDGSTAFNGILQARGGSITGNGGFAEVSGSEKLAFNGSANLGVNSGVPGTLLLDPKDVTIGTSGTWIVTPTAIQTALAGNNVVVNTSAAGTDAGDITVAQSVSWGNANTLTLSANRNITVMPGVTITNTGAGNLILSADNSGSGTGTVVFSGTGKVDFSGSTGLVSIFYNPTSYSSPTNYGSGVLTNGAVPNQLTSYMLVNNVTDLQAIQQNLAGAYALRRDIDASATASWNGGIGFISIGSNSIPFAGTLDGQQHTINGLTEVYSTGYLGLFGGSTGTVKNLSLTNESVTGITSNTFVGGLVAINDGTIVNVSTSGTVRGQGNPDVVGGLVGVNSGTIIQSSSSANVVTTTGGRTGGLVAYNGVSGIILQSHATGSVSNLDAVVDVNLGGLVGVNEGSISQSYATGAVANTAFFHSFFPYAVGGLVGLNLQTGTISQSYASGPVSSIGGAGAGNNLTAVGGLIGNNQGSIDRSYATGSVNAQGVAIIAGGLVGLSRCCEFVGFTTNHSVITESYSTGAVTGSVGGTFGGLVGFATCCATTTNAYWDTQTSGQATSDSGTGQTTAQLKTGLPAGFNPTIWGINPIVNAGYPYLRWQTILPTSPVVGIVLNGPPSTPVQAPLPIAPTTPPIIILAPQGFPDPFGLALISAINPKVAISTPNIAPASILFSGSGFAELQRRNALGLEYALANETFQNELQDLIAKVSALAYGGVAAPVAEIAAELTLKFKAAWQANEELNQGNYLIAANDTTRIFLELFVETYGSPALAYPLDIAKIATAFATAYTYGFIWGL